MQATSVKLAAAAEYRSIASRQADSLISQMWVSDHTPATLQANFASSTGGAAFTKWQAAVQTSGLPGVSSTNNTLPTVVMSSVAGGGTTPVSSSLATITIYWMAPNETTAHNFVTLAQIK